MNKKIPLDFNKLIAEKEAREGRVISGKEIAEALEITQQGVSKLRYGSRPSFDTTIRLMDFFDVCPSYFLTDK